MCKSYQKLAQIDTTLNPSLKDNQQSQKPLLLINRVTFHMIAIKKKAHPWKLVGGKICPRKCARSALNETVLHVAKKKRETNDVQI